MNPAALQIGYVPYSSALEQPGDRRRFVNFARQRGLRFEIADPGRRYDIVVLSERADLSVWRHYRGGKIVFDLIDSYLAIPRTSLKGQLRGLAKFVSRQSRYPELDYTRSVQRMCERADAVVCTTEEQKRAITPYCSNVHVILDSHRSVARSVKRDYQAGSPFRLAWEGMAQNLDSLRSLAPVLRRLERRHAISLEIVTDPEYFRFLGRYGRGQSARRVAGMCAEVHLHQWREETLAERLTGFDLAVVPLALDDPFASGKPENKLVLFWRMGVPVVASATPAYSRAFAGAGLPMACASPDEWEKTLERYMLDESARRAAGEAGRRYAEAHYGEERLLALWDGVFGSVSQR